MMEFGLTRGGAEKEEARLEEVEIDGEREVTGVSCVMTAARSMRTFAVVSWPKHRSE